LGKTVTNILLVAAAVAVNVIPGVGQAVGGAILSVVGTSFAAVGIVYTGLSIAFAALTVAGIQAGVSLVGLGPHLPKPSTTERAIKTSIPPRVSAYGRSRLYGAFALYETASDGTAVDVYAVHDGRIDAVEVIYLDDKTVTLSGTTVQEGSDHRYKNSVINIYFTLGDNPGTALSPIITLLPGIWTTNHRGDGVMILAMTAKQVKAKDFQETYPSGTVPTPSVVARWQRVFDWRDGTQSVSNPSTWKWSENSILHLAHYMLVREGKVWAKHFSPTLSYWTAAANDCDVDMALKHGGTEKRYRSCLVHKHTDAHKDVKSALLATCDGWMAPRADGAFVVYSGRYYTPTVTIGPDQIVSYSWESGVEDEQAINEIVVSYISSAHDYNTVEADPWQDAGDISTRGRINSQPLENQVPSYAQARRLAKRMMSRIMAPSRGTVSTNRYGKIARGQRYIHLTIEEAGSTFFDGPVEITQMTRNLATGGVTFAWIAADPNIDAWTASSEEGEAAANGSHVAPTGPGSPLTSAIGDYLGANVVAGPGVGISQDPTTKVVTISASFSGTLSTPLQLTGNNAFPGAASSNGYIYHSSTLGLVMLGQGSTCDFLLASRTGPTVMLVLPNTTTAQFGGAVQFAGIGTTASAANAFLDSANNNNLLRSTSSRDFKRNIRPISEEEAASFLNVEPVAFQSKADADDPEAWFFGFTSENMLEHRPELVHWGYREDDYDRRFKRERRLRKGRKMRPAGIMYERAPAFHQVMLRSTGAHYDLQQHRGSREKTQRGRGVASAAAAAEAVRVIPGCGN
jgi:hypothetical protein